MCVGRLMKYEFVSKVVSVMNSGCVLCSIVVMRMLKW